jgi:hypothetical protein
MADLSRAATIRRLYHDERCSITEIAAHLRCHPSDARWAISGRPTPRAERWRRWLASGPVEPEPLSPSLGHKVYTHASR